MWFSPQRRAILAHQNCKKCSETAVFCTFSLPNVGFGNRGVHFFNIRTYKSGPNTPCLVHPDYLFDLSGAPFFRIRCLKSGPKLTCFVHFYFKMWFSPQRRAILAHQNCKKCSETAVFCTFSLPNVPFATGACIFSTSELTKKSISW